MEEVVKDNLWSEDVERYVKDYVPRCYTLSTVEYIVINKGIMWHTVFTRKGSFNIYYIILFPERDYIKINIAKIETERYTHCIHLTNLVTKDVVTIDVDSIGRKKLSDIMYDFLLGSMVEIIR